MLKKLKTYSIILFLIIMLGGMLSGCGSVNGLKIEGTNITSEKVIGTLISSDRHSWYGDGYIASKVDDENIMYTSFESGKLKNIDIINKEITVTFFDREVNVF